MSAEIESKIAEAQSEAEAYQEKIRRQKEQTADTTRKMIVGDVSD